MFQRVRVQVQPTSVVLRTPAAHVPTIAGGCALMLVGASMLAALRPVNVFSVILGLVAAAVGAWLTAGAARAQISVTEDRQVVQRGDLRPIVIPAGEVREFYVDRTPHVVPWFSVWARLRSGEEVPLEQCRVLEVSQGPAHQRLQDAVGLLNRWLAER